MYSKYLSLLVILIIISCSSQENNLDEYPDSKKINFEENLHGYNISDSYRWLEDFTSEESIDWIERQNKFTNKFIEKNKYKKRLRNYLNQIWKSESISIPYKVKEKTFFYFNDGSFQQSKLMIKDCETCEARVLIDPNTFSKDGTISLGGTSISNDASLLVYSISDGGSDWRTWRVMNIATGEVLKDELKWAKFSGASWENDDSGFTTGDMKSLMENF